MEKIDKEAIIEALKEAGRVVLLALISWGIAKISTLPETQTTIVLTFILKGLDKWLYKKDKTIVPVKGATGLTGF